MRALARKSVKKFLKESPDRLSKELVGLLVERTGLAADRLTLDSYRESLEWLHRELGLVVKSLPRAENWRLFFEFQPPRREKRADLVIVADDRIFVVEYKTGAQGISREAVRQVEDYALDLRDFHETSANRLILPLVVANGFGVSGEWGMNDLGRSVAPTSWVTPDGFSGIVGSAMEVRHEFDVSIIDAIEWEKGRYFPVPPILEAALHIYRKHEVADIAESAAGSENLAATAETLGDAVRQALDNSEQIVCFVTGVPGSGKTLAGLSAVHTHTKPGELEAATFLSGNIPLVKVLREALARDCKERNSISKEEASRQIEGFIEVMQTFIQEYAVNDTERAPNNRVIILDEAQRAWDADKVRKKKKLEGSEPELILEIMGRHKDAVVIALVGGGQEIHDGEAGLKGWGDALEGAPNWKVWASPEMLAGASSVGGSKLFADEVPSAIDLTEHAHLHLNVSRRSFKARVWNEWVEALLKLEFDNAQAFAESLRDFPVYVTRELKKGREWLDEQRRGTRRVGLVSSSGNRRGRAYGIEVSSGLTGNINWADWFLNDTGDIRSSNQLEIAATEFQCQGLELDFVCVCWGGDLLPSPKLQSWEHRRLRGTRWQNVKKVEDRLFLLSKYRVLLTRARSGVVIWVPEGIEDDETIDGDGLDRLFEVLKSAGAKVL